jgi:hypothetical protein
VLRVSGQAAVDDPPKAGYGFSTLQVTRVKRVALAEIAGLVAAAKPAGALFGTAVGK